MCVCITALCNALSPIPPRLASCPSHGDVLVAISAFLFVCSSSHCGHILSLCPRDDDDGDGDDGLAESTGPVPPHLCESVCVRQEARDPWTLTSLVWKMSAWSDCDGGDDGEDDCGVQSAWLRNGDVCDYFSIRFVTVVGL